jgi:alpha-beta hydrolase superfamily lysophospholipase
MPSFLLNRGPNLAHPPALSQAHCAGFSSVGFPLIFSEICTTIPARMTPFFHIAARRLLRALAAAALAAALTQCARDTPVTHHYTQPRLGPDSYVSFDSDNFGYRKWTSDKARPETIVIGIHGFCGAAIDYENLGKHLSAAHPDDWVFAYEVRGQGNDPIRERRGDISDPGDWYRDLYTFTNLVRKEHPKARIVWFGESMGALIAAHAYRDAPAGKPPCDALVLSSPPVKFPGDFPKWKKVAVHVAAYAAPKIRLSIETIAGGKPIQMTEDTLHSEQSETNSWHIERHTLRLLVTLGDMVDDMDSIAPTLKIPTLILHGGKDFTSTSKDVAAFFDLIPPGHHKKRLFYPESHHLLMYDFQRDKVISDASEWIDGLGKIGQTEQAEKK